MVSHSKTHLSILDREAMLATLDSGYLISGTLNLKFRNAISNYLEKEYVLLYSSGSMALLKILEALSLDNNAEILLPNYICSSVYKAVEVAKLKPVLYDLAPNSWGSDYTSIFSKVTKNTRAIIVNHTFGILAKDLDKIAALNIPIVEDCCHALTHEIDGNKISEHSICSFYSFNATKLLATGEGGAVATNDKALFKTLENNQLDKGICDLLCSLGLSQLTQYDSFLTKRKEIAQRYFEEMPLITKHIQKQPSIFFRFPIYSEKINTFFANNKIAYRKGVDQLLNKLYKVEGRFPNSEYAFDHTVSIPIYPSLTKSEIELVIDNTKKCFNENSSTR